MKKYLFFDNASTTKCCDEAAEALRRFATDDYGNPSSSHAFGQRGAKAIRDARLFFAETFKVQPEQVIFTGSGTEADNLAVLGVAMDARFKNKGKIRVLASAIEHPAVKKPIQSLAAFEIETVALPITPAGQIQPEAFQKNVTADTALISIMQVNNIMGAILPVEELAREAKAKNPHIIFHTDSVQAFGRVPIPQAPSPVDLISISGHKVEGPKGVGALIVLNKALLKNGIRPLIWGGDQEGGFRCGTQNAGLIAGFHAAALKTLENRASHSEYTALLRARLAEALHSRGLLSANDPKSPLRWNSPPGAVSHIVNLSAPGFPSGPLAKLLEERGCLISTGSACSSQKAEPDPVLSAMGLPVAIQTSAIRISFSTDNSLEDVDTLAQALDESLQRMHLLLGGRPKK